MSHTTKRAHPTKQSLAELPAATVAELEFGITTLVRSGKIVSTFIQGVG